jgi:hypothetical protein
MKNINYDNFDLHDVVQKRNDVIDLKHNLQNYVQRLRKHENNLAIKEMGVLKGGGFFSGVASVISPFIRNIIKILSPVIGLLPGGGDILKILENLNTISSKIGLLEKTFESWEKNTKLNKALFGKYKKMCSLLNKSLKLFAAQKIDIDPDIFKISQIMQQITALQSEMKALKEQGETTFNKAKELSEMDGGKVAQNVAEEHFKNKLKGKSGDLNESAGAMISKELELDKLKQKLTELQLKLSEFVKGNKSKINMKKINEIKMSPQNVFLVFIQMAILFLPIPGMALIPKIQMIARDILRAQEILIDILDSISDIIFSQSICPDGITYLTDNAGLCKFIGDDLYDEAIEFKTLLPYFVESDKGKDMVRSLDPHYQSVRPGNIKNGDDILKLLINLLIRFIKHGKTEEIIKVLKNPDALAKFKSLKEMLIKFEKFPYKWPMGIKVEDYIFDILKGVIEQDEDMQQFFAKIANQLSGSPQNLESLIQMLLDNAGIEKNKKIENIANKAAVGADMANRGADMANRSAVGADKANRSAVGADKANRSAVGVDMANRSAVGVDMANRSAGAAGGGKKSKKKSSRKRIKGKKMGKYTRKR